EAPERTGTAVVRVQEDEWSQLVLGKGAEHRVERRVVGEARRAVVADVAPRDLVADAMESGGGELRGHDVGLGGRDVEVDAEPVADLRGGRRVDVGAPRLEPVGPGAERKLGFLRLVEDSGAEGVGACGATRSGGG